MNRLNKFKVCGEVKAGITGKLLYLILDELADESGETVIPQRKISDALQIAKSTVSRNLRKLKEGGYIEVVPQYRTDDGSRASNKYILK
jgi:DNA-binding MarR family transcriptional regulator